MSERINKTSIYSIIFLDIIDYSKKAVSLQIEQKEAFNRITTQALDGIAQADRIILDTGDGLAIALPGEPQEALFVALTIRDDIVQYNLDHQTDLFVRIGINLGPVRVVKDINGRPNIIGDGVNVAERVMSFANPNQILVSRTYYEVTSRLTDEINEMFSYFGMKQDKHVREHEIYEINAEAKTIKSFTELNNAKQNKAAALYPSQMWLNKAQLLGRNFWDGNKFYLLGLAVLLASVMLFSLPKSRPEIIIKTDDSANNSSANTLTIAPSKPGNIDATLDVSHLSNSEPVAEALTNNSSVDEASAKITQVNNSQPTKKAKPKKLDANLPEMQNTKTPAYPVQAEVNKVASMDKPKFHEPVKDIETPQPVVEEHAYQAECTQPERALNQCH